MRLQLLIMHCLRFIDNHIHQGNELGIDQRRIEWKRVLDMNDRALRHVNVGLGGPTNGVPREDGFNITVASEIMAILCLNRSIKDLKDKISRITMVTLEIASQLQLQI